MQLLRRQGSGGRVCLSGGSRIMNLLPHHIISNVLEVISASEWDPDGDSIKQKALDVLFRTISTDGAVFILPDDIALPTYVLVKNLDIKYSNDYRAYYHQFDPLKLMEGVADREKLQRLEVARSFSYDSYKPNEYYTDFLRPQKIHNKLIVNLVAEQEMFGRIVLMRSKKSGRYSEKETRLAKAVSPYLAHALAHNALKKKVELRGNILKYIEKQSDTGMLLLDEELHVIFSNQKAEEYCCFFKGCKVGGLNKDDVPSGLLTDCRDIKAGLKGRPTGLLSIPRKRTVEGPGHTRFMVSSKTFEQEPGQGSDILFMVCIEELPSSPKVNPRHLRESFHLSKREIEVAELLFSGLKNSEIAEKLFISEITVKKHLQNIYTKVGVNNRTSLVNKIVLH
jgi:DNA-binding CsgD family transcriptional regulator